GRGPRVPHVRAAAELGPARARVGFGAGAARGDLRLRLDGLRDGVGRPGAAPGGGGRALPGRAADLLGADRPDVRGRAAAAQRVLLPEPLRAHRVAGRADPAAVAARLAGGAAGPAAAAAAAVGPGRRADIARRVLAGGDGAGGGPVPAARARAAGPVLRVLAAADAARARVVRVGDGRRARARGGARAAVDPPAPGGAPREVG